MSVITSNPTPLAGVTEQMVLRSDTRGHAQR